MMMQTRIMYSLSYPVEWFSRVERVILWRSIESISNWQSIFQDAHIIHAEPFLSKTLIGGARVTKLFCCTLCSSDGVILLRRIESNFESLIHIADSQCRMSMHSLRRDVVN